MIKEIKFTDKAIKQINHLLSTKDKGSFFRIAIKGGGCSGFQYDFSFDQKQNDDDLKHENILIDKNSADLLKTHKANLLVVVVYHSHFNVNKLLECKFSKSSN